MTDPIADMLTRIRNANRIGREKVDIPKSKLKLEIARVMQREGFVQDVREVEGGPQGGLRVYLKTEKTTGTPVIRTIERVSRPGRRVYKRAADVKPVLKGMGIHIVSTPKGVMSDRECRREKLGGEVMCTLW